MNVVVTQGAVDGISAFVNYMRRIGYNSQLLARYKNNIISQLPQLIQGTISKSNNSNNQGYVYFKIPKTAYVWVFTFAFNPMTQMSAITGMGLRPLKQVSGQPIQEETHKERKHNVIRLTEADLRQCIREIVKRVMNQPHGLSEEDALLRFGECISKLYLAGKITEDEANELTHFGLYFSPLYTNGHYEDVINKG